MFQNISKMTLTSTWMLRYFKFSKDEGCQINQTLDPWGVQSLIIRKKEIFVISNYTSYTSLLISTFTCILY